MGELRLKIPEEFEDKIKELPKMEDMVVDFIRLKIFEHELIKSKLTLEDAIELGNKVKEGMLEGLKEEGLI